MSRVSANETTNKKPAVPTVKKTVDLDQDDNKENDTTAVTMVDEGIMEKNEVNGGTTITSDTPTTGTKGIPRYSEIRGKFSNLLGNSKLSTILASIYRTCAISTAVSIQKSHFLP